MTSEPWLWLLLLAQCAAIVFGARWALRRAPTLPKLRALLLIIVTAPLVLASLAWLDWLPSWLLRVERQWLAGLPGIAGLWTWWRLLRVAGDDASPRRAMRDTFLCLAAVFTATAVCGLQVVAALDRLAIVVAIDQSRSTELVPNAEARVERELTAARTSMLQQDRLGVLTFGANAVVQLPPLERASSATPSLRPVVRDGTDIERALRRALAELPADAAGKIVLMSDGVATRGDAGDAVAAAVAADVPIDVVVFDQGSISNVRIVKLNAPASVSEGETFEVRLVVEAPTTVDLTVRQLEDGRQVRERDVHVGPGKTLLSLRQTAQNPGLHRLEVRLSTHQPETDQLPEDNQMATFVRVRGQTRALLISSIGESLLEPILATGNIAANTVAPQQAPRTLSELSAYDLVVLEDVSAAELPSSLLDALASFVRVAGGGLVLMGSPSTLGPGGYARTPIEDVSPVSFDLKQDRRRGQLSEVIIVDYSGSMGARAGAHSKLDLANEGAIRSLALLSGGDRLGVLHVDTSPRWTLALGPLGDKRASAETIARVEAGGGGILLDPALTTAYASLRAEASAIKHVLLFADGSDAQGSSATVNLSSAAHSAGITTSVVALGKGDDLPVLERISHQGHGRFYVVSDASRIPAVFAQETITAARAAVREEAFIASKHAGSSVVRGIDFRQSPPLAGYVVTLRKPRALVPLRAKDGDPLLAIWNTGLGQCAVFTSDYGGRWGTSWTKWAAGAQLFVQLARSVARNEDDSSVRLDASMRDGRLELSVDALSAEDSLDNFRNLSATIAKPDGQLQDVTLRPSGAGRYAASLPVQRPGTYLVSVADTLSGTLLATTGLEMSTGDELEPTGTDRAALRAIAERSGGTLRESLAGIFRERLQRRPAYRSVDRALAWLGALFLLASVVARRLNWQPRPTRVPMADRQPASESRAAHLRSTVRSHSRQGALPASPTTERHDPPPDAFQDLPKAPTTAQLLLERRRRRRQNDDR